MALTFASARPRVSLYSTGLKRPSVQSYGPTSFRQTQRPTRSRLITMSSTAYDFQVTDIDGAKVPLDKYKGKVALVVNLASRCGLTKQYAGLNELYKEYADKGFTILGFPSNQFAGQEPGTNAEIKEFACSRGAEFPLFAKIDVNGSNADPLYGFLKSNAKDSSDIEWNFGKFLINKKGEVAARFGARQEPAALRADIERLLAE